MFSLYTKKRALVLGGGSARGLAHIGFIKKLEENNIEYDMLIGTSMGAFIGAMYMQRENIDVVEQLAKDIVTRQLSKIIGLEKGERKYKIKIFDEFVNSFNRMLKYAKLLKNNSYIEQRHINLLLNNTLLDMDINCFKIQFASVAVDLIKQKTFIFTKGNTRTAIRSSISIPGAISPVKYKDMLLVDGGVTSIVPVKEAISLGAEKVLAIDVSRRSGVKEDFQSAVDIMFRVDSVRGELIRKEQISLADIVVNLEHMEIKSNEYSKIDEIIMIGEKKAEENMDQIRKLFSPGVIQKYFITGKKSNLNKNLFGVADFGSNSLIINIFNKTDDSICYEKAIGHKLFNFIKEGQLSIKGIKLLNEKLKLIKNTFSNKRVFKYKIIGTEMFRHIKNIDKVQKYSMEYTGKKMNLLPWNDEAILCFIGNTYGRTFDNDYICILDVGGASSEFVYQVGPIRKYIESIPLGSRNLASNILEREMFDVESIRKEIRNNLKYCENIKDRNFKMIVSGGTITTFAGYMNKLNNYDYNSIDGVEINIEEIDHFIEKYFNMRIEHIRDILPYNKDRASHLLYGLTIISEILHLYNIPSIIVSCGGVRKGVYLFSNKPTYL